MRVKSKAQVHSYLQCIVEMLQAHPDNLAHILKYTIYNELSAQRNPNNMQVVLTLFQVSLPTQSYRWWNRTVEAPLPEMEMAS